MAFLNIDFLLLRLSPLKRGCRPFLDPPLSHKEDEPKPRNGSSFKPYRRCPAKPGEEKATRILLD